MRHASHGLLGRVLTGRMAGVGLSEAGRAEAVALAVRLGGRPIGRVLSSPLQRARETAEPLAARLGLPLEIEPGLDEIDFGDWTGRDFAALDGQESWDAWNRRRSLGACPGGETMLAAQARAVAAVLRAATPQIEATEVVCVSHQDVLKAVVASLLGLPLDLLDRFALDPAHRCTAVLGAYPRLEGINLPP